MTTLHTFRPHTPKAFGEIWDALVRRDYIVGDYRPLPHVRLLATHNRDIETIFTERWAWVLRFYAGFGVDRFRSAWWLRMRPHRKHILVLDLLNDKQPVREFCQSLLKEKRP